MKILLYFLVLFLSVNAFSQDSTIIQFYDLNKDIEGASYQFSFIHLTDTHIGEGIDDYGTPGYNDTMPDIDNGAPTKALRSAVDWINQNHLTYNIKFVVVSGDLTDSGEKSEFMMFKSIMDNCQIPYIPLMGNHDTWPYFKGSPDVVAPQPKGDSIINEIFNDKFEALKTFFQNWDDGTRLTSNWNPQSKNFNNLQNFSFNFGHTKFIFLDFNPRYAAKFPPGPGIGPEAELHNFAGGTFKFLKKTFEELGDIKEKSTVLVSHHPPVRDAWGLINAFSADEYELLGEMFLPYKNKLGLWLAGHIHRRHNYSFSARNRTIQVMNVAETAANKEYENGKFLVVNVFESQIFTAISENESIGIRPLFPNPATDFLMLNLERNLGETEISIVNLEGKVVRIINYDEIEIGQLKIDLVNICSGTYLLKINNNLGSFIQKFEKI